MNYKHVVNRHHAGVWGNLCPFLRAREDILSGPYISVTHVFPETPWEPNIDRSRLTRGRRARCLLEDESQAFVAAVTVTTGQSAACSVSRPLSHSSFNLFMLNFKSIYSCLLKKSLQVVSDSF